MYFGKDIRFVLTNPFELRRREAGHDDVAALGNEVRLARLQFSTLKNASAVIPQNSRPEWRQRLVEQRRAMHLTGVHQSDGFCSDQRGRGRDICISALLVPTTFPASSSRSAFTLDVPMSIPKYTNTVPSGRPSVRTGVFYYYMIPLTSEVTPDKMGRHFFLSSDDKMAVRGHSTRRERETPLELWRVPAVANTTGHGFFKSLCGLRRLS